jgi:hypothetical protein
MNFWKFVEILVNTLNHVSMRKRKKLAGCRHAQTNEIGGDI